MLVPHPQQTHTNITHQPTRTHTHSTNPSIHTHTSYPHPPPWSPGSLCHSLTLSRLRYELNDSSDASPRTEGATARPRPSSRLEGRPEAPLCTLIITSRVVAGCHTVVLACAHPSVCVCALCIYCAPVIFWMFDVSMSEGRQPRQTGSFVLRAAKSDSAIQGYLFSFQEEKSRNMRMEFLAVHQNVIISNQYSDGNDLSTVTQVLY